MGSNIPKLALSSINKNLEWAILTGKNPVYQYQEGKRINDIPVAWKFSVLLPGNCYSALTVKLSTSNDPLAEITEEMIESACATMKPILVRFIDCCVNIYAIDGLKMAATASGVELLNQGK